VIRRLDRFRLSPTGQVAGIGHFGNFASPLHRTALTVIHLRRHATDFGLSIHPLGLASEMTGLCSDRDGQPYFDFSSYYGELDRFNPWRLSLPKRCPGAPLAIFLEHHLASMTRIEPHVDCLGGRPFVHLQHVEHQVVVSLSVQSGRCSSGVMVTGMDQTISRVGPLICAGGSSFTVCTNERPQSHRS